VAIKILIVEECEAYVAACRDQLKKLGYSEDAASDGVYIAVTVVDGKDAIILAENKVHFNVVICALDLLCNFNGLDVLRRYRELGINIPFIVLVDGRSIHDLPTESDLLERTSANKKSKRINVEVPTLQYIGSNLLTLGYALEKALGTSVP
jgi:CheY-like chemotaxis protein